MEIVEFGPWRFAADPEATRLAYKTMGDLQRPSCSCDACQNFRLVRDEVYPPAVLALFEKLGIIPGHEAEIFLAGARNDSGLWLYGGWNHLVGRLLEGPVPVPAKLNDREWLSFPSEVRFKIGERFELFLNPWVGLVAKPLEGLPLLQLEFEVWLPWLLENPPEFRDSHGRIVRNDSGPG